MIFFSGLRTVYVDPNPRKRTISFDLMNREFLWHGFAECGVFFLSLINVAKLKRNVSELLFPKIMPGKFTYTNNPFFLVYNFVPV